jgi:anti-sigma B factor antagonist
MLLRETIDNDVAVLTIEGNFLCQPPNVQLRDRIQKFVAAGVKCVVIDLGEVTCINSDGLGILIGATSTLRRANVELKLANASDLVDNLLILTQLTKVFQTHETVGSAVSSFKSKKTS